MTEQAENELICEKLLGWKPSPDSCNRWIDSRGAFIHVTPTFTTWAEAGLILDALRPTAPTLSYSEGKWDCFGGDPYKDFFHAYAETGPLAIRAAALEYIRSLP